MRQARRTLAVVGMPAGLGIGGWLIYALKPAGERQAEELYNTENRATAETITSGPRDYAQAPRLGPPLPGDLGGPIVSAQQRGENVPVPPVGAQPSQPDPRAQPRSEEHTSELQSLMRNSYAVFCLKKKNNQNLNLKRS